MQDFSYKKLIVWQKSIDLVVETYKLCDNFPKKEQYALCSQMQRASVSIASNIAEGSRRRTVADKKHFYIMAFGSASELETQIEISLRLHYCNKNDYQKLNELLIEVLKMLNKMSYGT
jgi:four helix bundle protein